MPLLCSAKTNCAAMILARPIGYAVSSEVANLLEPLWMPHASCLCDFETPTHCLLITANSSTLNPGIVRFGLLLPYMQLWKIVNCIKWTTCWINVVCQNKLNWRFSTTKKHPWSTAPWISFAVKKYNLLALEIFRRSMNLRPGNPLGCSFDRNGFGAGGSPRCLRFSGIDLALEAETQGGAKKILMTFSLDSHCISKLTPASVVRSATATGAKCIDHSKSLQLSRNPWRTGEDRLWESKFYIHFFQPQKRASNKSSNLICRPELNIIRLKNTSIYTVNI